MTCFDQQNAGKVKLGYLCFEVLRDLAASTFTFQECHPKIILGRSWFSSWMMSSGMEKIQVSQWTTPTPNLGVNVSWVFQLMMYLVY